MTLIIILLILVGLYLFMICPRVWGKVDRTPFAGVDYAHRGLFDNESAAPENSLKAIKKAVEAGYGIEFDVQLSKDDIPVVFHDASLKRMCGIDGKVWDYTLEELQQMCLAKSQETIPTFKDVLAAVDGKVPLIIEYKMDRADTKVCVLGNELLKEYQGVYCVESFHPMAVRWYKNNRPDVMRGQLCEEYWKYDSNNLSKPLAFFLGFLLSNFLARPDFVAYKHQDAKNFSRCLCTKLGALPVCFTAKNQKEYDRARKYFQLIIFDSFIPKNDYNKLKILGGRNMNDIKITDSILYVGVDDKTLDLFESQYVIPNGISYNSYVIMDEKITIMDTVDARKTEEWLENVSAVLGDKEPSYLVVSHMEPDHAANIKLLADKYPNMKVVGNAKTFAMIPQFFDIDLTDRMVTVKEGDTLELGVHTLQFFMAPMVHWPEVMVTYEQAEKVLFSADGFGKFGALDADEAWTCEARRYYFNIVGKYGVQVQALLKKAATLDIHTICPLHGPILKDDLAYYIGKYDIWSKYEPEDEGVFIAYASIHGNTAKAAKELAAMLEEKGAKKVAIADLSRDDMAEAVEDAFRHDKLIVASATYDGGLFPCMEDFLSHLKAKNFQKRKVGLVENGSWAPMAAKYMKAAFESMKNIEVCDTVVTIKSSLKDDSRQALETLAEQFV